MRFNDESRGAAASRSNVHDVVDNAVDNPGIFHTPWVGVGSVDKSLRFSTRFPLMSSLQELATGALFPYFVKMSSTSPQLYDYDYIYLLSSIRNLFRVDILPSMRATSPPEQLCVS